MGTALLILGLVPIELAVQKHALLLVLASLTRVAQLPLNHTQVLMTPGLANDVVELLE